MEIDDLNDDVFPCEDDVLNAEENPKKTVKKSKKKDENKKFTKSQFYNSKEYFKYRDLINALLEDDFYSKDDVEKIINNYLEGEI